MSVVISYADMKGASGLGSSDRAEVWNLINKLRRKGFFSHKQKKPIYLSEIYKIKDRVHKAALLLCFFFALRKSEARLIGDSLSVEFCDDSFLLGLRDVVLKSNATPVIRVGCLCNTELGEACLHNFEKEINAMKSIDLLGLTKLYFEEASHSVRVGSVLSLLWEGVSEERIVRHMRWSSALMLIYYRRNIALWKKEKKTVDYIY